MFGYLLITCVLGTQVFGLPVISDPCGGENPSGKAVYRQNTSQLGVSDDSLHDVALEASIYAKVLKEKYNDPSDPHIRISDSMKILLKNTKLENFPVSSEPHGDNLISTKIQHHYDNVSIIAVFADAVYTDEAESTRLNHFQPEMVAFNSAVARLLCKIHLYAISKGVEISRNIGQEAMSPMYRGMKNAPARDFVIYRDSKKYLKAVAEEYGS